MSALSSQAWEELTSALSEPATESSSSASPTPGDDGCSPSDFPACPATRTFETFNWRETETLTPNAVNSLDRQADFAVLISSRAVSHAKICPSPDDEQGFQASEAASSSSSPESQTLFGLAGFSSRTYPASSPRTAVGTSESCLERWPTSGTAWHGGFSTAVTSECRSDDAGCSSSEPSLADVLEPSAPAKYSLSARAAAGILRRAEKRGRQLPSHLSAALEAVARMTTTDREDA